MSESILAKRHTNTLSAFALGNMLVAFDYDGTLAPIAPTPAQARMRAATRTLLGRVARCYPCVIVSGRALDDISRRVHGIPVWYVFGNHGCEPLVNASANHDTAEWVQTLRNALPDDCGVVIEDKRHTVTLHYRGARNVRRAREAALRAALQIPAARVVGGSRAVNLLPRGGPDKASAVRYAMEVFACDTAVYVGDDDTDEDVFGALGPRRLLGVRVGAPRGASHARFHLKSQADIDPFLERLLAIRASARPTTRSRT